MHDDVDTGIGCVGVKVGRGILAGAVCGIMRCRLAGGVGERLVNGFKCP